MVWAACYPAIEVIRFWAWGKLTMNPIDASDSDPGGRVTPAELAAHEKTHIDANRPYMTSKGDWGDMNDFCLSIDQSRDWHLACSVCAIASWAPLGRIGCFILSVSLLTGIAVIIAMSSTLDGRMLFTRGMTFFIVTAIIVGLLLFAPSNDSLAEAVASRREEAHELKTAISKASEEIPAAHTFYAQATESYKRLQALAEAQSRTRQLLATDWKSLRGVPFEDFLQEVFEDLGYRVERTKVSRDQGVDLILKQDGTWIAVQAKGYAESVGNSAVQEVHTGMWFHKCKRFAVITNSTFTSSARELAIAVGCNLIEGSQIPDLVRGTTTLGPARPTRGTSATIDGRVAAPVVKGASHHRNTSQTSPWLCRSPRRIRGRWRCLVFDWVLVGPFGICRPISAFGVISRTSVEPSAEVAPFLDVAATACDVPQIMSSRPNA